MKKFISLFLVISMVMCNFNARVVEALASYGNEVKSFVNTLTSTKEEKEVGAKEDKGLEKETVNNEVDNNKSIDSTKYEQVKTYSDKKSSTSDEENIKEKVILFYYLETDKFYYINTDDEVQELSLVNENISKSKNKNKINLNNILKNDNLPKIEDTSQEQEVILIITGAGSERGIKFDNSYIYDIPFNIVFWGMKGKECSFSFENVKSINIIGENTIENSATTFDAALTYSFNDSYSNPLNIFDSGSFIAYNTDKDSITNNIVYLGNDTENSEDETQNPENNSIQSGYSSVVNMSFEDDVVKDKKIILQSINGSNSKEINIKTDYNLLSILLVNDNKNYILREEGNQSIPYYYQTNASSGSDDENGMISGRIKTKVSLNKNSTEYCYEISNKKRVEVVATKNYQPTYYLVNNLQKGIDNCKNIDADAIEFIFLGDYEISQGDVEAIKNYDSNTLKITFKTKIDEWVYLLNIGTSIELMSSNNNQFSVTFDEIKFKYNSENTWIYANATHLVFGDNVEMEGPNYPSVSLAPKSENFKSVDDSYLMIKSGTYDYVIGSRYTSLKNINVSINGGTFNNEVIGVDGKVSGNAKFIINNNNTTFKSKVLALSDKAEIGGSLDVTINGGSFNKEFVGVNGKVLGNVKLTIANNPIFRERVLGVDSKSDISGSLDITINGGSFSKEFIGVDGKVLGNIKLTVANNPMFRERLLGVNSTSNIGGSLDILIRGGSFKDRVIGLEGCTINNTTLTISGGIFDKMLIGLLSSNSINKVTLEGLFNRYLFSNKNQVNRVDYSTNRPKISINITSGTFKNDVIGTDMNNSILTMKVSGGKFATSLTGNSGSNADATINIDGTVTIPNINNFTKLVLGEKKTATLSGVSMLNKGSLTGDLYLNKGSKIKFKSGAEKSLLNDIILDGDNNALVLDSNNIVNTTEDKVLMNLKGDIRRNQNNNKLHIEFANSKYTAKSDIYLIKFEDKSHSDITGKYNVPTGHYLRDNQEIGCVILSPQTVFNLKYDLAEDKLYMINNGSETLAWWYTEKHSDGNVNLNTDSLYKYKGYDLFKGNTDDRNIILTGTTSGKNITINNNLENINNVNVVLENINLKDSNMTLNGLKYLRISGENNIDSLNKNETIFTYNFNSTATDNKVLFDGENPYLKICTNQNTKPFNGLEGERIDLKLHKEFNEDDNTVRLKNKDIELELNLSIPTNTQRIGLLLKDKGKYNLYYGQGNTGNSVYVSGKTNDTFTNEFKTSSDNSTVYEYVRRARPVNRVHVDMPAEIEFGVNVRDNGLDEITIDNWSEYFYATEMKFENNSKVVEDEFIDDDGTVYEFSKGESNPDVNLEYMGVHSLWDSVNGIELISKDKLDSEIITDGIFGVKLALQLDGVEIDEHVSTETPLKNWFIKGNDEKILSIEPSFKENKNFFNISKNMPDSLKLKSSHRFIFRYGLKN